MIVKYKELRRVKTGERPQEGSVVVYGYSASHNLKFPRVYIRRCDGWWQLVKQVFHTDVTYPSMYTVIFDETEI